MVGVYRFVAPAAATPEAEVTGEVLSVHQPGEVIEITEVEITEDGRKRGKGPDGWVSFVSERGASLLEEHAGEVDREAAGPASSAPLTMPTGKQWTTFNRREGLASDGEGPVGASCVARAVRELLPGFDQTPALRAAYQTLDVSEDGSIDGRDLKLLFRRILFFQEQWGLFERLRQQHG
eukprot:COSAG05_NODE_6669_length_923_cov_0.689320_1_plen_178_part_10